MENGVYQHSFIVTPDLCDQNTALSLPGVLTIIQSLSAIHAEVLGIGVKKLAEQKKFWVMVHSMVQMTSPAWLMEELTAETWAERCSPDSLRCFRSYILRCGDREIARCRVEWAILNYSGERLAFRDSGIPEDYEFADREAVLGDPSWMDKEFADSDMTEEFRVRSTDIDFGRHMNNILYARKFLNQFSAKEITAFHTRSMEIHFGHSCKEGEKLSVYAHQADDGVRMAIRNAEGRTAAMAIVRFNGE